MTFVMDDSSVGPLSDHLSYEPRQLPIKPTLFNHPLTNRALFRTESNFSYVMEIKLNFE